MKFVSAAPVVTSSYSTHGSAAHGYLGGATKLVSSGIGYGNALTSPNIAAYSPYAYGHGLSAGGIRYASAAPAITNYGAIPVAHVQPTLAHAVAKPVIAKQLEYYVSSDILSGIEH